MLIDKTVEKIIAVVKKIVVCMEHNYIFFAVSIVVCEGLSINLGLFGKQPAKLLPKILCQNKSLNTTRQAHLSKYINAGRSKDLFGNKWKIFDPAYTKNILHI